MTRGVCCTQICRPIAANIGGWAIPATGNATLGVVHADVCGIVCDNTSAALLD